MSNKEVIITGTSEGGEPPYPPTALALDSESGGSNRTDKFLRLWRKLPRPEGNPFNYFQVVKSSQERLSELVADSGLSRFGSETILFIAEGMWVLGRSPQSVVKLRDPKLRPALKEVFDKQQSNLEVEVLLSGALRVNQAEYFDSPKRLEKILRDWESEITAKRLRIQMNILSDKNQ